MPDNTPLGELDVVIGADWSDLVSSISDAVAAATTGASAIADAFSDTGTFAAMSTAIDLVTESIYEMGDAASSVASGMSDMAESVSTLGDSASTAESAIADVGAASSEAGAAATEAASGVADFSEAASGAGDDAGSATDSIHEFADAESEAGSAGEEGGSGISVFRGSLLELAEGLAVTEGLKELATDALEAYSSIQQATISLTALTGSAEAADQMIGQLEATALQIPVATESLISAAQRMTAFGLTADQVTTALNDAANASFATGGAFDSTAQRITMMAAAGTAGARQLVSLGITADQLAAAMNSLGVSSDATASTITKAFKALDVDTRLEVIDAAVQKFDGIAVDSAQTVGGAWQILQNQWEEVAKETGAVLAPLAMDVMAFASAVGSGVKEAIDLFNELPKPLQDLGLVAVTVLGASGPILTGLAALSLTVIGLQSVPEVFARLTASLGLAGGAAEVATPEVVAFAASEEAAGAAGAAAAPEVAAFATAETAAGEGAVTAGAGMAGLATGAEGVGAAAFAAGPGLIAFGAAIAGWAVYEWISELTQLGQKISDVQSVAFNANPPLTQTGQVLNGVTASTHEWTGALAQAEPQLIGVTSAHSDLLKSITNAIAPIQQVTSGMSGYTVVSAGAQAAADKVYQEVQKLTGALADQQGALASITADYNAGVASANDVAAAQAKVTSATNALNSALGEHKTKVDAATASWQVLSQEQAAAYVETTNAANSFAGQVQAALGKITDAQAKVDAQLDIDVAVWLKLATTAGTSAGDIAAAYAIVQTAVKKTGDDWTAVGEAITNAMQQEGVSLDTLETRYAALASSGTATGAQLKAAWQLVQTAATATGVSTQQLVKDLQDLADCGYTVSAAMVNGQLQINGLKISADGASASVKGLISSTTDAATGITIYRSRFDEATVSANTHAAAAKGAASAINSVGYAASGAQPYVSAYNEAQMTGANYAETAAHSIDNAGLSLTKYGTVAGEAYTYTTQLSTGTQALTTNQEALYQAAIASGQAIQTVNVQQEDANGTFTAAGVTIQGVTNDLQNFDAASNTAASDTATDTSNMVQYWDSVATAIDSATTAAGLYATAEGKASGSTSGKGGQQGYGESYNVGNASPANLALLFAGLNTASVLSGAGQTIIPNLGAEGGSGFGGIFGGGGAKMAQVSTNPAATASTAGQTVNPNGVAGTQSGTGVLTLSDFAATTGTEALSITPSADAVSTQSANTKAITDAIVSGTISSSAGGGIINPATSKGATSAPLAYSQSEFNSANPTQAATAAAAASGTDTSTTNGVATTSGATYDQQYQDTLTALNSLANSGLLSIQDMQQSAQQLALLYQTGQAIPSNLNLLNPGYGQAATGGTAEVPTTNNYNITGSATAPSSGDPLTEAEIQMLAGGGSVSTGALTQAQDAAISADVAAYIAAHPLFETGGTSSTNALSGGGNYQLAGDTTFSNLQGSPYTSADITAAENGQSFQSGPATQAQQAQFTADLNSYFLANPPVQAASGLGSGNYIGNGGGANSAFGSGSNGSASVAPNVTFNISGVTPSAATALMNQAITQLRLGARLNL